MQVVVTGGAGFIGSTLVDRLLADGHRVAVIDNLASGNLANLDGARVAFGEALEFHELDVRSPELPALMDTIAPEVVFHLAAQADVRVSVARPLFDAEVNVLGGLNVIEAARLAGAGAIVLDVGINLQLDPQRGAGAGGTAARVGTMSYAPLGAQAVARTAAASGRDGAPDAHLWRATIAASGRDLATGVRAADGLLVVHVIPGSPAERAGIRASDHLVGVGGRSLAGMGVDEAAHLLQGPEGSLVTLAILRAPAPARAVTVRREQVEVPSIEEARMLDATAGIAALKLTSFQKTTAADLEAALRRLDAAGMRALVIDLRGNPGGLLSAAVDVADLFLERGLVVATRGRSPDEDFNYSAGRPGTWRMPLVVLIDGDSASSSEIFAGAIRDHGRGTIVGARSYGKGSIQGIFPLDAAGVGMRLTTAKFFSPRGLPYSGVGVEPDVAVHATARPVDGQMPVASGDAALAAATDVARRAVPRPAARPSGRSTAAR